MLKSLSAEPAAVAQAVRSACRQIPPAFPLAATVAVNPFIGQAAEDLATAAERLGRVAPGRLTMPRAWFAERIADGRIMTQDLAAALAACPHEGKPADVAALVREAGCEPPRYRPIATVAELAAEASGTDWPAIIAERIGHFAGQWFDAGQALWPLADQGGPWATFRAVATHDLSLETLGLTAFCAEVAQWPLRVEDTIAEAVRQLMLPERALEPVFHRLLMTLGGWAQLARARAFEAEREGGSDATEAGFLAIALMFEATLFQRHRDAIADKWEAALSAHCTPLVPSFGCIVDSILQDAADRASAREIAATLAAPAPVAAPGLRLHGRPKAQLAFCIDVRSEPLRRALEAVVPDIETRGFAGFFGLPVRHRRFASDVAEARLPVLLSPGVDTVAGGPPFAAADRRARIAARAKRAWGRFKLAAVSSFAFVEAAGPIYVGRLVRDSLRRSARAAVEPAPIAPDLGHADRVQAAATILGAMSLTSGFAPLVALIGHGAEVVNDPMASALQCGACGGHGGDVNARLLAALLNDPDVRSGLAARGLDIPQDTRFLAGLHDTVADTVSLFDVEKEADPRIQALAAAPTGPRFAPNGGLRARAPSSRRRARSPRPAISGGAPSSTAMSGRRTRGSPSSS